MTLLPYIAILSFILVYLSVATIRCRRRVRVALGTGGEKELEQYMRAQANFIEYTPWVVLLLFILEIHHVPAIAIHLLGGLYILGRLSHAYSLISYEKYDPDGKIFTSTKYRRLGMQCTFSVIIGCAIGLLILYYFGSYDAVNTIISSKAL